ncbi:MAG: hypothetical protein ABIT69_05230 [Sphingomicrobium sp.]
MTYRTIAIAALAATALIGCSKKNHTIVADTAGDRNTPASAPIDPASLPPAIVASKIYRCKDNHLIYIDWLADNLSANVRTEKTGAATLVKAPAAGKAMVSDSGHSLTGSATGSSISITLPGGGSESCKA